MFSCIALLQQEISGIHFAQSLTENSDIDRAQQGLEGLVILVSAFGEVHSVNLGLDIVLLLCMSIKSK